MFAVRAINPDPKTITTLLVTPSREAADKYAEQEKSKRPAEDTLEYNVLELVPGTECTVNFFGTECDGVVQRTSQTSVWIKVNHYRGTTPTHRFICRKDGSLVMAGAKRAARFDK